MIQKRKKQITTEKFDELFDDGNEDVLQYADLNSITKRVNVDFPAWVVDFLDQEAKRIGITRQSVIKTWIISTIDKQKMIQIDTNQSKNSI